MFVPKGLHYIYYPLNTVEKNFFTHHTFICSNFLSASGGSKNKIFNQKRAQAGVSKFNYYTVAFGFKDFISSTSFNAVLDGGQLENTHGLDIIFNIRYVKKNYIYQPNYFLSCFQLPF